MSLPFNSRRSPVISRQGCVACSQPLASQIGIDILKSGGNAADAAVAVAAALNVTEPCSTGLGGDAFCLFYDASSKSVHALNGSGRAPGRLSLDLLAKEGYNENNSIPFHHGHTVTVPGAAAAWADTVEKFGSGKGKTAPTRCDFTYSNLMAERKTKFLVYTHSSRGSVEEKESNIHGYVESIKEIFTLVLSLSQILAPAIQLAEDGFAIHQIAAESWSKGAGVLQNPKNKHGKDLLLEGQAPRMGDIMKNPCLATVMKDLGNYGKKGFYEGRVATAIVDSVQSFGGVLTSEDLKSHVTTFEDAIFTDYKGYRLWEIPPNGQGMAALMALNILEEYNICDMVPNSAEYLHLLIEALKLAFTDTAWYCADASKVNVPMSRLLSKQYAARRRQLIHPERVIQNLSKGDTTLIGDDTVYFCTADRHGNSCSFINSTFMGFGTGIVPEGCGFTLQNRGAGFSLDPKHPNVLAPNKRPYHTIIPAMLTDCQTGQLAMTYGVMGGYMQPQGHVQVLLNMLEFGMNPQEALDQPRICIGGSYQFDSSFLCVEEGIKDEVIAKLKKLGHNVNGPLSGFERKQFGRGQIISDTFWMKNDLNKCSNKTYWAGSDPRGDGMAIGY